MPAGAVFGGVVNFGITLVILFAMMAWYGFAPGWPILLTPALLALALLTSLGVALWLSALNALYRDVQFVLPFLAQIWLFLTPVLYPATLIPEKWPLLYAMNSMVRVTESFRWAVLGSEESATGFFGWLKYSTRKLPGPSAVAVLYSQLAGRFPDCAFCGFVLTRR